LSCFSGRALYAMATTIDKDEGTVLEISERALPYSSSADSYTPGFWAHEVCEWSSTVPRTYYPLAPLTPLSAHLLVAAALPADYHYGFELHSNSFDLSIRVFSLRHKALRSLLCPLSGQEIRADERCTDTLQVSPWNGDGFIALGFNRPQQPPSLFMFAGARIELHTVQVKEELLFMSDTGAYTSDLTYSRVIDFAQLYSTPDERPCVSSPSQTLRTQGAWLFTSWSSMPIWVSCTW
jgi:hypothetical protein